MATKLISEKLRGGLIFQYALLFVAALVIWQIFYPGLMSPDSLAQYEQAKNARYDDWHPPLMSLVLRFLMIFGGDIGLMTLLQCLTALFGLRSVIILLIAFFSNNTDSRKKSQIIATLLTLLFLIPIFTPYMFFSVIFWKDAWVGIGSLWIISYVIWLYFSVNLLSRDNFIIHAVLISLSSSALVLIRHNSLVMLPMLCIIVGLLGKIKLGKKGLLFAGLPLVLAITLNPLINLVFDVGKTYTGNTVLASDMAVMLKIYPELDSEFPLSARHKNAPTVLLTDNGGIWNETTDGKPCPIMNKKICDSEMPLACFGNPENTIGIAENDCYMRVGLDNQPLKSEYFNALTTYPFKLLRAKVFLFKQMLHSRNWYPQAVSCEIAGNSIGLKSNERFSEPRNALCYLNHDVGNKFLLNYISGVHPLWLFVNFLFVLYFTLQSIIKRTRKSLISLLICLLPLAYYLSYVLASTTPDYRFMYPSTLMMQALFISLLVVKLPYIYRKFLTLGIESEKDADKVRKWSPQEKAEIVIDGLKGRSDADICNYHKIPEEEYLQWKEEFLRKASLIFEDKSIE